MDNADDSEGRSVGKEMRSVTVDYMVKVRVTKHVNQHFWSN